MEDKNKTRNENIKKAIFVSQMEDTKGFKIFMDDMEEILKEFKNPDINLIRDINDLNYYKGYIAAIEKIKYYFEQQKNWALKPMINEDGEKEILNNKKNI